MSAIESFLGEFFGEANDLDIQNSNVASLAQAAREDWPDVPVALPRVGDVRAAGLIRWYVLSPVSSEDRRLEEELSAWIGSTYSATWRGQPALLEMADPIDRAATALRGGSVYVIDIDEKDRASVRENLARLRRLWRERPLTRAAIPLRASELIRDFNLSLANGNPQTARTILDDIDRRALLSAENELFLEISVLESEARWSELASHPRLEDLSARQRPWPVTRALLRGLYRAKLAAAEDAQDLDVWIEQAGDLEAKVPGLFSTRGPLDAPEVAKIFALVDRGHADRPLRTRVRVLEAQGLSSADRAFLEWVVELDEVPEPADPLDEIRRLVSAGEFDPAWDRALDLEPSADRTAILVQCAVELATASAARIALDALGAMPGDASKQLLRASRRLSRDVEDLEASLGSSEIDDVAAESWPEWFEVLHAREDWPEAVAVARKGASEWSGEGLLAGKDSSLTGLIRTDRPPIQERLFLEAAPFLLEWLTRLGSSAVLVGVKKAFLEAVCLGDVRADVALETALAVAESIIDSGVDDEEYMDVLANLETIWHRQASTRSVSWLADCFEVLSELPGNREALTNSATSMIGAGSSAIVNADPLAIDQLTEAASKVGIDKQDLPAGRSATADRIDAEVAERLKGTRVGVYTLTPQVGVRVKQGLEGNVSDLSVIVNSDTKSTTRLQELAKTADYMIVMLRSATHAATDAIGAARPAHRPTLRVGCRGSSGVVAAFLDSVRSA